MESSTRMNTQATDDPNDEIDLRELLGTLLDHKWLIGIVTGVFFVFSVAYAVLAAPVYQANAMVQVEQKIPSLPGLSDLSQLVGDSSPQAVTEIALLESRMVVGRAVDKLHLDIDVTPDRFPLIGGFLARHGHPAQPGGVASPWLGLSRYDWGGSKLVMDQLKVPSDLKEKDLTLVAGQKGAYTLYDDDGHVLVRGQVGQVAKGQGVTARVTTLKANPGMHFNVVRQDRLHTVADVQKILSAAEQGKDSGIINVTYQDTDPARATDVLNAVVHDYVQQNIDRAAAEAANSLKFVRSQLPQLRTRVHKAENALSQYQTKVHTADLPLQTKSLLKQIVSVDTNLSQLNMQQAEVERKFTPDHPAYQALAQQISELTKKKNALESQISALPDTQQQLLRLTRDVKVATTTLTDMLAQEQQLNIARAGTVGNARLVDSAAVDTSHPVKPKKKLVVVVGTMLGAFLAVAFVFLRQMLNRGVEDPKVLEDLGLPVYASIPLSEQQRTLDTELAARAHRHGERALHLLAERDPADLAIEAVRSLRTSLHFAMLEARNNVLMISGASPEAGKTFVATNLAAVIAQAGQRVLLLDADMRKGTLHKVMGSPSHPGLSELLSDQATFDDALHRTALEGLHFIGRGHVPPNPSELLMHARFTALLEDLSRRYDLVIVDTPPILAVTDAAIVGHHAGTSLLVARFGMNQAREIELAAKRLTQNRVELKGAIFNAVQKRAAGYYTYGYYEYRPAT